MQIRRSVGALTTSEESIAQNQDQCSAVNSTPAPGDGFGSQLSLAGGARVLSPSTSQLLSKVYGHGCAALEKTSRCFTDSDDKVFHNLH
jgi:hypothetical protein